MNLKQFKKYSYMVMFVGIFLIFLAGFLIGISQSIRFDNVLMLLAGIVSVILPIAKLFKDDLIDLN